AASRSAFSSVASTSKATGAAWITAAETVVIGRRLPCDVVDRGTGRTAVNVEIWSDIACPWCAVGKRRFERALEAFEHRDDVTVTFRSFELDPDAPPAREGSPAE